MVREAARRTSSWRAETDLRTALGDADVVGLEDIDTRALVRHLRDRGAMRAGLSTEVLDVDALLAQVQDSPGMIGADLAGEVTTAEPYVWQADGRTRASASSPSTTGSSATSCACWPSTAARCTSCRPAAPPRTCWRWTPTGSSCPTAPATRPR